MEDKKEYKRQYFKKYRENNRKKLNEYRKQYYETHKEKEAEQMKQYHEEHKETIECNECHFVYKKYKFHNSGCPLCANPKEKTIYLFLKSMFNYVEHQFKLERAKNIRYLPYDIALLTQKTIIEVDGIEHQFTAKTATDVKKQRIALDEGYTVIRIQGTLISEEFNWRKLIVLIIFEIENKKEPKMYYITENSQFYKRNQELMNLKNFEEYFIERDELDEKVINYFVIKRDELDENVINDD